MVEQRSSKAKVTVPYRDIDVYSCGYCVTDICNIVTFMVYRNLIGSNLLHFYWLKLERLSSVHLLVPLSLLLIDGYYEYRVYSDMYL